MQDLTEAQIASALANLGNYRVLRAQVVAHEGPADGISGALLLSLGLRETGLRNIEGGAKLDPKTNRWVAQDDPKLMDVGVFQISRRYHAYALARMFGVATGTWGPVKMGMTANDPGFVPRYEDSLQFTLTELHESMGELDEMVAPADLLRSAVAAHNAGVDGAKKGYLEGDVDRYTTGQDYSAWVLRQRVLVNRWLNRHPNWQLSV